MKPQFIVDEQGHRTGVLLSIADYDRLLDELDDAHVAQLYDQAKAEPLTFEPLENALADLDAQRRVSSST